MNFLLIGSGNIAIRHQTNLRELLPSANISVLTNKERYTGGKKEKLACFDEVYFDRSEIPITRFDVALICSPATSHIDDAIFFAEIGMHIFIEKPLSNNLNRIEELIKIIKTNNMVSMVGYPLRFSRSMIAMKDMISAQSLGKIVTVRSTSFSYLPDWRPGVDYRKTVSANKELGGGVLLEVSHEIDYLCWLFGEPEIINSKIQKISDLEIDVEDTAFIDFKFMNKSSPFNCNLSLDFSSSKIIRKCEVIGEKGELTWDGINNSLVYNDFNSNRTEHIIEQDRYNHNDMYLSQMKYFIESIEHQRSNMESIEEAIKTVEIILNVKAMSEYHE
ncbi:MAG: hypothetical protein CMP44_04785 [Rickettsiales bacterium]|nr:hypothetical protein [Rickettsiales bacterium]|tara:strand:- start:2518 stop:3513 length:996 start_codon:yes stop_codon:yes gene_type:complete